ncbi:N-acetyltransferase family protein [Streptococcus danieliae]|uniref:N-acetyltransferase family protein n=1 Tax=Streptococcus danieliae TaxID=747656 RepID=A0A7Z0LC83_9STRE|nr:GNAT family N-acetyltransferase [Streptococcus danieliae]MBF0716763.1 N-acetyltransferase [Streptococcus danieliae]NYS48693.1 N-acetyltransferase family protein [Streptococcus danieliae]
MDVRVRFAQAEDAEKLLAIYAHYVEHTAISFEHLPPSLVEFQSRMRQIQSFYPYLVAEADGQLLGYCYAGPFRSAASYAWSVESTIYLNPNWQGKGLGHLLYDRLEEELQAMGILSIKACIGVGSQGDPYSSKSSELFHAKRGYKKVAHFPQAGYKFQRWYDMIWMEKNLGDFSSPVTAPQSILMVKRDRNEEVS